MRVCTSVCRAVVGIEQAVSRRHEMKVLGQAMLPTSFVALEKNSILLTLSLHP